MDQLAYIKRLEARIHNQRAQLRWWNEGFVKREVVRRGGRGWTASRVCALLRRLGQPHIVNADGRVCRKLNIKRKG